MAVVTSSLVSALRVGFQREFQDALSSAPSQWDRLSTRVPSSSAGNTYGWIGQFPKLREWSGDRSFKNIKEHGYSVMNNLYEATVDIPRTAVEDDDIGVYAPLFREMAMPPGRIPTRSCSASSRTACPAHAMTARRSLPWIIPCT